MKLKKVVSLLLALVMSFALAAPAFAAEPDDGNEGIMPLAQVYSKEPVSCSSGNGVGPFTTTPSNGKYLQVWFHNQGSAPVVVILTDAAGNEITHKTFAVGDTGNSIVYVIPTPDKPCTYRVRFECPPSGAWITGEVAAAQYTYNPNPNA